MLLFGLVECNLRGKHFPSIILPNAISYKLYKLSGLKDASFKSNQMNRERKYFLPGKQPLPFPANDDFS